MCKLFSCWVLSHGDGFDFLKTYFTALLLSEQTNHRTLDAGPLAVMISTLVVIFTIGLGDRNDGGMSAYSVFNRGYQQFLGSVDADRESYHIRVRKGCSVFCLLNEDVPLRVQGVTQPRAFVTTHTYDSA